MITRSFTYSLLGLLTLAGILGSCSNDGLQLYDQKKGMLSFNAEESTSTTFTFMSRPESVTQDTVWFTVDLIGFASDRDRFFELEQILPKDSVSQDSVPKPDNNKPKTITAEAGVHYVSFDSPEAKRIQRFPANAIQAKVPVILLRDTSLKTKEVTLRFKLKASDDFNIGYKEYQNRTVVFSDKLARPNLWITGSRFLGKYSRVKHNFMIVASGKPWDDAFMAKQGFVKQYYEVEFALQPFVRNQVNRIARKLKEENEARKARGEDVLRDEDGDEVKFPSR